MLLTSMSVDKAASNARRLARTPSRKQTMQIPARLRVAAGADDAFPVHPVVGMVLSLRDEIIAGLGLAPPAGFDAFGGGGHFEGRAIEGAVVAHQEGDGLGKQPAGT